MYLSRLLLRRGDLNVARDLGDVAELHRTIMRAFPATEQPNPRATFGVLYRVEAGWERTGLLVQSEAVPFWDRLPDGYLSDYESKSIAAAIDAIAPDAVLRFLLVANPTRKTATPRNGVAPRNSRRVALVEDADRLDWLQRRGERAGFELIAPDWARMDALPSTWPTRRRSAGVVVRAVRFEGQLRVSDAARFKKALREGVGPAKAYGCGLLSVART